MNLEEMSLGAEDMSGELVIIKYVNLKTLRELVEAEKILFEQNPKKHDLGAIAQSIKDNGFVDPPKWDKNLNNGEGGLVYGNGRTYSGIQALTRMFLEGEQPPKGIGVDKKGEWYVPIKFGADAESEIAAKRFAIDHNNLTMAGGDFTPADMMKMWEGDDYLELAKELADNDALPITLDGDDLDLLLQLADNSFLDSQAFYSGNESEGEESNEYDKRSNEEKDFVPNLDDLPARVKLGDLVIMGKHRLICGDCTDRKTVTKLMKGEKAVMCFTDPPYNVDYDPEARHSSFSQERLDNPLGKIENDVMSDKDFRKFLDRVYTSINNSLEEGCPIYICHADTMGHLFRNAFIAQPWKLSSTLIWKKTVLVFGRSDYHWMHEPILYGWKEGEAHRWHGDRKQTTVVECSAPHYDKANCDTDGYIHPTQKPTLLVETFLKNSSQPDDLIIDFFGGSGTTLIACQNMGRVCYMTELDPKFANAIVARWEKFTGQSAVVYS